MQTAEKGDRSVRQVVYFCFQNPEKKPPCLTELYELRDRGYRVTLVAGNCRREFALELRKKGIHCITFQPFKSKNIVLQKMRNFLTYKAVWDKVRKEVWNDDTVLWIGTEESAFKHWPLIRGMHPVILNALEFYETKEWQSKMRKIVPETDVLTACEPHRAEYMKEWWHLRKVPYVLRNKPYEHPRKRFLEGQIPETRGAIEKMQGKKTLVYQGGIVGDRDLSQLATALRHSKSDYYLVLSGPVEGNTLEKIQECYDKVIYLGNIPYQHFLEVTSHAHICVAFYKDNCINNRYCAPNKIYEYAGFGIPMLCNNIPGLETTVGEAGAGICVDFRNEGAVIEAIQEIDSNYEKYAAASTAFYDRTDNTKILDQLLEEAFALTKAERR